MGAGKSKLPSSAVRGKVARKYPTSASPSARATPSYSSPPPQASPSSHQSSQASFERTDAINTDAQDPAFTSRLQKLGVVQPNPFLPLSEQPHTSLSGSPQISSAAGSTSQSTSSTSWGPDFPRPAARENSALTVFRVREELQRQYEVEQEGVGRKGFAGRRLLDIGTVREVLRLRGQGVQGSVIEGRLGLGSGTVERIGAEGVVDVIR